MKYITLIVSLLMGVQLHTWAQAKAAFDKTTHDFGTILWKTPAKAVFTVTNNGDKPLVISNVTTSCGCAVADWTKQPIAPGKSGTVTSTFDAKALGRFRKSVGIYCNAADRPIYLTIRGEVSAEPKECTSMYPYEVGPVRIDKQTLEFDDANKGDKPFIELLIANISEEPYTPVLMHLPPYLTTEATPNVIKKGGTGKVKVVLDTDKLPKFGITTASVYLSRFPGDKVGAENEIPVSAVLLPDFSKVSAQQRNNPPVIELSSTEISMLPLAENEKRIHNVTIRNAGRSDLEIQDLQVFNSALGVQLKKRVLKPGTATKLKITAFGKNLAKVKGEPRVLMITNDPKQPKIIIKVNVTSKK